MFVLVAMAACTADTQTAAICLVFFASLAIGYNEAIALPLCSICIRDQQEIGTATGVAGSARSAISTIASTIYSVVLTIRVTKTLSTEVPAAVIKAGLPASSVADYMTAIAGGAIPKALAAVKGLTPAIEAVGARAYQVAYSDAYRTIFLTSLGFGGLAMIIACFVPNVEDLMVDSVAATLHGRNKPEVVDHLHEKIVQASSTV